MSTPHIMIAEARFYEAITDELVKGTVAVLEEAGCTYERIAVPGAFELPAAIRYAIHSMNFASEGRRFDGYVALGCVIRGETTHYDYVCEESARGLQELTLNYALALGYGILTVENEAQAWARAKVEGGKIKGGKGGDAARACLAMIELKRRFKLYPR